MHCALFAALAFTGRGAAVRSAWLLPGLTGYAVVSEIVQSVPLLGRSSSPADVLADVLGVVVGWLLARRLAR